VLAIHKSNLVWSAPYPTIGVSKKTGKPIKPRKLEKKTEKTEPKKNRLNFWKNRPVRFGFDFINKKPKKPNWTEQKPEKPSQNRAKPKNTEPNRKKLSQNRENQAKTGKPSQTRKTEPNRFEPVFVLKNRTEPNRNRSVWPGFGSVSVFFSKKKFWFGYFFLIKTEPNRKLSPLPNNIWVWPMLDLVTFGSSIGQD